MLNFCDFIQVYVFTTNHHLKLKTLHALDGDYLKKNQGNWVSSKFTPLLMNFKQFTLLVIMS